MARGPDRRVAGRRLPASDAWDVKVKPMDVAMRQEASPSRFELRLLQVCFPAYDLGELHRRLEEYRAGRLVKPAPADWTTVGRPRTA